MPRFFEGMGGKPKFPYVLWQEYTDYTPFTCNRCGKEYPEGGKRYLGNLYSGQHQAAAVICPECRWKVSEPEERPKLIPRRAGLL